MSSDFCEETYQKWKKRDWMKWLGANLVFPFTAKIAEDHDRDPFSDITDDKPFSLGHTIKVLNLDYEDDLYGVIVKVREKRRIGSVSLCNLRVTPKVDINYQPVYEYVVWFANR